MNNPQIYINGSVTFLLEVEICLPDVKTSTNVEKTENVEKSKIDSQNKAIRNDIVDSMKSDFAGLLSSEDHCDVVIKCQNQEFKCHVAILAARSPVFGAMFQHKMTESVSRKVGGHF